MVINRNSILYFSGTGNTYEVSKKVAEKCDLELINISKLIDESEIQVNCDVIGIACPIYYGGVPKSISKLISKIECRKNNYIFALATYGGMPANPFLLIDNKLKQRNLKLSSGFLINMPGNYIANYGAIPKRLQEKKFKKVDGRVEDISSAINSRKVIPYQESPYIIDRPFSAFSEKKVNSLTSCDANFRVDDKCSNCGICARICPVKNIMMVDNKPHWNGYCEQCMTCIQYCPKEAIQYGNKTIKRKRYRNPNVNYLNVLLDEK